MNLATGNLVTKVRLVDVPSFANMRFAFSLVHNSGVKVSSRNTATNWIHSAHQYMKEDSVLRHWEQGRDRYGNPLYWGTNGPTTTPGPFKYMVEVDGSTQFSRGGADGAVGFWTSSKFHGTMAPKKGTRDWVDAAGTVTDYDSLNYKAFGKYWSDEDSADINVINRRDLISEEGNGFGDRFKYEYGDKKRLWSITEVSRTGKVLRVLTINYSSVKDAIDSVTLSCPEKDANGTEYRRTLTWTVSAPSGALANLAGPANPYNPRKSASFTYVDSGCRKIATEKDQNGGTWSYVYDGSKVKEIDPPDPGTGLPVPVGSGIRFRYDDGKTYVTDQLGRVTTYSHGSIDGYKRIEKVQYPAYQPLKQAGAADGLPVSSQETFDWDEYSISKHVDVRGFETTYGYVTRSGRKDLTFVKTPDGKTKYSYNASTHLLDSMTDPLGIKATFSYNAKKQPLAKVIDPTESGHAGINLTRSWSYDSYGRPTEERMGTQVVVTNTQWDDYGQPTRSESASAKATTISYDGLGNKKTEEPPAPRGATTYSYDDDGALTSVSSPAGTDYRASWLSQSDGSLVSSAKDMRSYVTATNHDFLGRGRFVRRYAAQAAAGAMIATASGDDIQTETRYDAVGNVAMEISGKGEQTIHTYDALNRRVRTLYPDNTERVWQYDKAGNLIKSIDGRGWVTVSEFDWANRVKSVTYPTASNTPKVSYTYRADGLRDSMTDGGGVTTYEYTAAKQLKSCYQPLAAATVRYTYDDANRKKTVAVGAQTWTYSYFQGQLDTIGATVGNQLPASYKYYDDGSLDTLTFGNGFKSKFAYDGAGRVVDIWHRNPADVDQRHLTYQYSGSPNVTSMTDVAPGIPTAVTTYSHDFADRLTREYRAGGATGVNDFQYAYDKANNRLSTNRNGIVSAYTTGANDRFLSGEGWAMPSGSYDNNGNPTVVQGPAGSWSLAYNAKNQVTRVTFANGSFDTFKYNGDGTRVEAFGASGTSRSVLDDQDVLATTNASNAIVEYRLAGVGTVVVGQGATTNVYDEADLQGSTVCARDGAGAVVRKDNFDAYGQAERIAPGPWRASQYAGGHGYLSDLDTGFSLCGARYYIPVLGRFLNQDPIGHEGGLNLYAYCNNSPLMKVDPSGLLPRDSVRAYINNLWRTYGSDTATVRSELNSLRQVLGSQYKASVSASESAQLSEDISLVAQNLGKVTRIERLAANRTWGIQVQTWFQNAVGGGERVFRIGNVVRRLDAVVGNVGYEVKTGYVYLSSAIRQQIAMDAILARGGMQISWHFYGSATGAVGASPQVLNALRQAGLEFTIHARP